MTTKKQPAFKMLEGVAIINKAITSLQTRGKKYEADLHQAAVSCLNHAGKHGDITLAIRLIEAVPSLTRSNALKQWFIAMGRFKWDDEGKTLAYDKSKATLLDEALANPFWTFKANEGGAFKPFDFNEAVNRILAQAKKAHEKGQEVPTDKLEALAKLIQAPVDF